MGDSEYSFSLTTFSRTGKLLPIEYALNAVANGRTSLGICCSEGVVLATDMKLPSVLVETDGVHKIEVINKTGGFCFAGLGPDYRVLGAYYYFLCRIPFGSRTLALSPSFVFSTTVKRARKSAQAYYRTYGEVQNVRELTKATATVMQEYTQRGGVRPFGVSILVAGLDAEGEPSLFQVDPSGAYFGWKATAIGKNYVNAKSFLEKRWTPEMGVEDAVHTALLTLREGLEGEMTSSNIQVGVCKRDGAFHVLTPAQIQDYLDEAN